MLKLDINGNTVSRNEKYLRQVIKNLPANTEYDIDSVNRVMVKTGDGGTIIFFMEEEQRLFNKIAEKFTLINY